MTRQCEQIWRNQAEQSNNNVFIGRNALTQYKRTSKVIVKATLFGMIKAFFKK
jgi:hypothetical protein